MDSVKITAVDLKPVLGEKIRPSAYGGNTATGSWPCSRLSDWNSSRASLPVWSFSKGIPPPPGDPGRGWNPRGGLPILLYRKANNET